MNKCIWVVEDDQGIREMVSLLLQTEGYRVQAFENASKFKTALAAGGKIDMLLTDVMLPDGNGLYLCELAKMKEKVKRIPVMVMSAHLNFCERERFCRADDFISKPFNIADMLAKVNRLVC